MRAVRLAAVGLSLGLIAGCGGGSHGSARHATRARMPPVIERPDLGRGSGFDVDQRDGVAAWSRRSGAGYRLVVRLPHERPRDASVRPSAFPFDVNLGTDARGRTVATYSRCRVAPGPGDGLAVRAACRLHLLDLGTGAERLLLRGSPGQSLVGPAMSRGLLAYARLRDGRAPVAEILVVRPGSGRAARRVAAFRAKYVGGVVGLDFERDHIAAAVTYLDGVGGTVLLLGPASGPLRHVAAGSGGQENNVVVASPSIAGRYVYWAFSNHHGYKPRNGFVVRRDLQTGEVAAEKAPGYLVVVAADPARPSAALLVASDAGDDATPDASGKQTLSRVPVDGFADPPAGLGLRDSSGLESG
jgi:hypothetical protein